MRQQSLICSSRDELRWHLRRSGGQVDQRRFLCPLQCLVDRADVCFATVQAAQAAPSTHYPNPPQPLPPSHTNGVFAWLVNRADCSHLTAFRFKYLSVSWWAKSALTVRLLFKVADRLLGERGWWGGIYPSPVKWDSFPCVHILSWLRFFPPLWIAASIKLPLHPRNNVLVSWPRLSRELAERELLVDWRKNNNKKLSL